MKKVKKLGKKILSLGIAAVMIIGLMAQTAVPVFARLDTINTEAALRTAINNAVYGDTIKLDGDIELATTLDIPNKSLVFDLNGKTLSSTDRLINIPQNASLEIKDTSEEAQGKVYLKSAMSNNAIVDYGVLAISSGTIISDCDNISVIRGTASSIININGGAVKSEGKFGTGIDNYGLLNVLGGVISGDKTAIPNNGVVNIVGGTVSGEYYGVYNYSGDGPVNIRGGAIGIVCEKVINIQGNTSVEIILNKLTSGKVTITGRLTGSDNSIVLNAQGLTLPAGTVVAKAINADNAVLSKFTLTNLDGKRLAKDGANIVVEDIPAPDTIIPKSISINTTAPIKGCGIDSSSSSITDAFADVKWSSDNGNTWAVASGIFAPATVYKTKYIYTANSGYGFDNTMATGDVVVVNGRGKVDYATVSTVSKNNDTLTVQVTWERTGTVISASVEPGTSTGKLKAIVTSSPTDHFAIRINSKSGVYSIGKAVPSEAKLYQPGDDIDVIASGTMCLPVMDESPYLCIYDVDRDGKVMGTYEKRIKSSEVNLSSPFSKGDGTVGNPYQIETTDQLKYMGLFSFNSMTSKPNNFILNKDIDLGVAPYNTGEGWAPIPFAGNLNGNGKTIKNLMVNMANVEDEYGVGLFSVVMNGSVKNLAIANANVTGGGVAGILAANVSFEHIEKVYVSGTVTGKYYVGGLVGRQVDAGKTILDCYSLANVNGSGAVGGLVGAVIISAVKTSYATGKVSIINPTEEREKITNILYKTLHGGLVGFALEDKDEDYKNTFENNYYDKETTGQVDLTGALPKGTMEMKDKTTFTGFDFNTVWGINSSINGGYPYLQGLVPSKEQTVPAGLVVTAPTSPTSNDGKIEGTKAGMEYKLSSASTWTAITGTSVTGLAAGSYQVRYAEKSGYNAGAIITITIPAYVAPTPSPKPTPGGGGSSSGGSSGDRTTPTTPTTPTTSTPSGNQSNTNNVGQIIKDQQQDTGAPTTSLNTTTEEFKSSVFTAEELSKIGSGENAKVILKVTDIGSTVSEADKNLITKSMPENATVMFVDLSLYKKIGNGEETKITETKNKISISIEVPEALRNADITKSRTYHIVRIHDGVVSTIEGTYDPNTHLFTFETDRFSTYALTYKETNVDGDGDSDLSVTNDFKTLCLTATAAKSSQKLSYTKVKGAAGYFIYGAPCGVKNQLVKLADVTGKTTSYNHKGLRKGIYYKYLVQAYKIVDGKKVAITTSKVIHVVTIGTAYGNPAKVTSKVSTIVLKVGNSKQISAKVNLLKGKKMENHTKQLRYETTNEKVATVSENGKIKAIGKGTCYIYVYAENGVYKKIKITVK